MWLLVKPPSLLSWHQRDNCLKGFSCLLVPFLLFYASCEDVKIHVSSQAQHARSLQGVIAIGGRSANELSADTCIVKLLHLCGQQCKQLGPLALSFGNSDFSLGYALPEGLCPPRSPRSSQIQIQSQCMWRR